ncbi:unnamed protein product [Notodromas monacha]|uniref:Uncharacterized protein n=1 Tax=Notodromas monacha TaxID=399045 RepID=A0A7R9BF10_9CRUS|nr:unnamed protein product [Notodromas monacha]CAG0913618.1 unnamed protein product [Notodromas monacha]
MPPTERVRAAESKERILTYIEVLNLSYSQVGPILSEVWKQHGPDFQAALSKSQVTRQSKPFRSSFTGLKDSDSEICIRQHFPSGRLSMDSPAITSLSNHDSVAEPASRSFSGRLAPDTKKAACLLVKPIVEASLFTEGKRMTFMKDYGEKTSTSLVSDSELVIKKIEVVMCACKKPAALFRWLLVAFLIFSVSGVSILSDNPILSFFFNRRGPPDRVNFEQRESIGNHLS